MQSLKKQLIRRRRKKEKVRIRWINQQIKNNVNKQNYLKKLKDELILPLTIKYTIESIQAPFKQIVTLSENQMK